MQTGLGAKPVEGLLRLPELNIALFSFAFHFIWEMLQVPAFTGMGQIDHWTGVLVCVRATLGDVAFALSAFWITVVIARSGRWIDTPTMQQVATNVGVGLVMTIGAEIYYTRIVSRWAYSTRMPIVSPFGIGLSPLLQWIVVPLFVLFVVARQRRPPALGLWTPLLVASKSSWDPNYLGSRTS